MSSLAAIKSDVHASRAQLAKSFQEVRRRLSLPQLAEDALAGFDWKLGFLGRVKSGIRRLPLLAAVLLAGAGWLVSDASRGSGRSGFNGLSCPRHPARSVNNTTNLKGEPR
jgi:hypothetical protein